MTNHLFQVMMNDYSFSSKPTEEEVRRYIRPYYRNQRLTLDIKALAVKIEAGHSFYANVLDYSLNQKRQLKQPDKWSKSLNGTCYVPTATSLISVDVDHGNFTLNELKACLSSVPYALIYQTMSYSEDKKKYRVLFIANRCFKDEAEFRYVQESLIYLFAHPFAHRMEQLNQKVDFSVKDPARISFPGKVLFDELYDRTFDLDRFIEQCQQINTPALIQTFKKNWQREVKRREGSLIESQRGEGERTECSQKPFKAPQSDDSLKSTEEVMNALIRCLSDYKASQTLPLYLEFSHLVAFVNRLPLHDLLNHPLETSFRCLLPDHEDQNPSAVFLLDEKKETRYFCHGCGDGHSLSVFDVIERLCQSVFHYDRFQTIQFLGALLGIQLTTPYRNEALMRLQLMRDFLNEWSDDHPLKKMLIRRNLFNLYELLINLASTKIGLRPVTLDQSNPNPTFFASSTHLHYQLVVVRGYRVGMSDARKVREKLTELAYLGLIRKFDDDELDVEFLKRSEACRQQAIEKELEVEGVKKTSRRRTSYFEIPMLSYSLIDQVLTFIERDKQLGTKVKGRNAKQVLHTHGEAKVKAVLPQGLLNDTKLEKRFISALEKAVDACLAKRGYFTEKQLLSAIDSKQKIPLAIKEAGKTIKSHTQRKQELLPVYLPGVVLKKELTKSRVNKETRHSFQIPDSINSSTVIYF